MWRCCSAAHILEVAYQVAHTLARTLENILGDFNGHWSVAIPALSYIRGPCTDTTEGIAELFVYLYLRQFYGRTDPSPTRAISE